MVRARRWATMIAMGVVAPTLAVFLTSIASGQFKQIGQVNWGIKQPPRTDSAGNAASLSSIRIIENGDFRRIINVGRDCIKDSDWAQAVQALQAVLNEKKDHYVKVIDTDLAGKEITRWTSVKFEANSLIGSMPADGLEKYEFSYGKDARDLLDEAKAKGDRELLADVAQRFCHTKAGIEANELLATLFLARGQVFTAALRFEKLLSLDPERAKLSDMTLFKAALAFRRAGDAKNYEATWKRLEANLQGKGGMKVGDNIIAVSKLQDALKDSSVVDVVNLHDWPMIRGNKFNNAQASGSPPLLDSKLWMRPLFKDKTEGFNDEDPDQASLTHVKAGIDQTGTTHRPVLPGFFPIVSQNILVYRSHRDVRAVALKDMDIKDEDGRVTKVNKGQILWKTLQLDRSLAMLLEKAGTRGKIEQWLDAYQKVPGYTSFLYENSLLGTLSTDDRLVYVINDLAVPPIPYTFQPWAWQNPQFNPGQDLKPLMMSNELHAYDLVSGKRIWDINTEVPQFKDSHFLSQPLSVGGKLYVLNERNLNADVGMANPGFNPGGMPNQFGGESELRLVCIDPTKVSAEGKPAILEPIQVLGHVVQQDRFVQDPRRRVNAVHLGFGEGILVCPTNAGEVFGIDLMTRSLVWSYPYRDAAPQQIVLPNQPNMGFRQFPGPNPRFGNFGTPPAFSKWVSSPPALHDGKVVFTAPDADSIHCVNLRDGKPVWKKPQADGDQYMAGVYQGRVLIVGKSHVRALNLKDGLQLWSIYTGDMPSGQGIASKGIYYIPLSKGEILAVDIERGQIKAHNRAAVAGVTPGNLVFYENMVLSQTANEVAAYPQLVARLDAARLDSVNEPDNLTKLTDYGELLLKDGQVHVAVETLMKVHDRNPAEPVAGRVKERLFEALTDLVQVDFAKASKEYLTTYEALCAVPGNAQEQQLRKAKFFRLVGHGREAQGNLVEAFQMYKEFGALPLHREQGGISSPEEPDQKIPVNVWLRGRIAGMFAKASPAQRAPLEAKIAEEWQVALTKKNPDVIRSFVDMFDTPFKVGREARIHLAEAIMEQNDRSAFLEAELLLHQVMGSEFRTDPRIGGRALADLAQLEEKKGTVDSMRLAAAYYRELGRDFHATAVRGLKTGADLFNELATDKRFLPFLEDANNPWGPVKVAARALPAGSIEIPITGFVMQPEGDHTPFARQHRLLLDPASNANAKIHLRDITTNQDRWTVNLGPVPMNQNVFNHMYQQANVNGGAYHPNARFRFYQVKGHLIVCQVGVMVYCLDGDTGKKLWEMQTVENIPANGLVHLQQVMNDQEGNHEFIYWNQLTNQRFRVTLGRVGSAQASYVAVLSHKGLTVVDPLRGTTLWKKTDVAVNSHVFGDDHYLFLVSAMENGSVGAGYTIRASDGEVLRNVPDFSNVYQGRIRISGRHILAGQSTRDGFTVRKYDILAGKDDWSKVFPSGSIVLHTEDDSITGVIDPKGAVTVLDAGSGAELLHTSIVQGRVTIDSLKQLRDPFLLKDAERFYIALNRPIDTTKVGGGILHNNFISATRCSIVNGWFLALHRQDGEKRAGDQVKSWKKGDLAWHSYMPLENQMIVLEQFDQNPVALFTVRYNEILPSGGNRWVSVTQSMQKTNGKMVFDSGHKIINFSPMFSSFQIDLKSRTINLLGFGESVQHYVDDGKGPPPMPQGAQLNSGVNNAVQSAVVPEPGGAILLPIPMPNRRVPAIRRIVERELQIAPRIEIPEKR